MGHPRGGSVTTIIPRGCSLSSGSGQLLVAHVETLFGEQTYGITVSRFNKGRRLIVNARPLPTPIIKHYDTTDTEPSQWGSLLSKHIAKFSNNLADIWITSSSVLTNSGVEEFFHPSALSYKSIIYLTIMPTERFPCYSEALPISFALEEAESLHPCHTSQLLLT